MDLGRELRKVLLKIDTEAERSSYETLEGGGSCLWAKAACYGLRGGGVGGGMFKSERSTLGWRSY